MRVPQNSNSAGSVEVVAVPAIVVEVDPHRSNVSASVSPNDSELCRASRKRAYEVLPPIVWSLVVSHVCLQPFGGNELSRVNIPALLGKDTAQHQPDADEVKEFRTLVKKESAHDQRHNGK